MSLNVGMIGFIFRRSACTAYIVRGLISSRLNAFCCTGCGASNAVEGHAAGLVFDVIFRDGSKIRKKRCEAVDGEAIGSLLGRSLLLGGSLKTLPG